MDDLENELFSTSLHTKISTPGLFKTNKRSGVQDFDEDDPLADILSSSNETTPKKKSAEMRGNTNLESSETNFLTKNKIITDLFGLGEPEEVSGIPDLQKQSKLPFKLQYGGDWLGLKGDPEHIPVDISSTSRTATTVLPENSNSMPKTLKKSISDGKGSNFNLDMVNDGPMSSNSNKKFHSGSVLDELISKTGDHNRKPIDQSEPKKKESVFDSFTKSDFEMKQASSSGYKESTKSDFEMKQASSFGLKESTRDSYIPSPGQDTRSRRPTRRKATNVPDPLGLFTSTNYEAEGKGSHSQASKEKAPDIVTQSPKYTAQNPNISWLGGNTSTTSDVVPAPFSSVPPSFHEMKSSHAPPQALMIGKPVSANEVDMLTSLSNLEDQVGQAAAQQQKSLISALALKKQEDLLLQLQAQHAALLKQHEQQLGALVQRQFQRQKQMMQQQELIQEHIESLMLQPPPIVPITLPPTLTTGYKSKDIMELVPNSDKECEKENIGEIAELKDRIVKQENEKAELLSKLTNERKRYDEHVNELQTMYRMKLSLQEETIKSLEARLHNERDQMEKDMTSKLTHLKEEHLESSHQQAERMAELHAEWLADLKRLGEFHRQAVEMLRSEQTSTLEHWKSLQTTEIASIKEASVHSRLLETALDSLRDTTLDIKQLKDNVMRDTESLLESKKDVLQKQELLLAGLKESLEKQVCALETERSRMTMLTNDLEARLIKQRHDADEERHRFQDRDQEWIKEKFKAVAHLEKEKQDLQKLQLESRAELADLVQQKIDLAKDVARLETTLQLQRENAARNSMQAEEMVAEAKATLQAAQEAGGAIEQERDELEALKLSIQSERERLSKMEREIVAKEVQVQKEVLQAAASKNEGLSALEEARRLERERTEHASDLAQRLLHLKERENRLAKEKLAVTLQWKRIQEFRENAKCAQCCQFAEMLVSPFNKQVNIVDPLPIIMKLEAEQGMDYSTLDNLPTLLESVASQ